jgi:1,4-alpha-glucan branching enzyme
VLVRVDGDTVEVAWSDRGYPAHGHYRDYHHHTIHHHTPWANDGGPYDHARALVQAQADAKDFVARTSARLREQGADLPGGGLAVCALDTELLGHWWYEGAAWLSAVVEECERQGLELIRLDDALERIGPAPVGELRGGQAPQVAGGFDEQDLPSSWGACGDLSTWSAPVVADVAFALRRAELQTMAARPHASRAALRELLALQSSDWAFILARELAGPYARERLAGHGAALSAALSHPDGAGAPDESVTRNIAAYV